MSIETRVNKKTGQPQFSVRYRWKDETGRARQSQTGWFDSANAAQKEANKLKKNKERAGAQSTAKKREAYVRTVFETKYYPEIEENAKRDTTERTGGDMSFYYKVKSVLHKHIPDEVGYLRIKDLNPMSFRLWADKINKKNISGGSVAQFFEVLYAFNHWLADKGYYTDTHLELDVQLMLNRYKKKPISTGARKDRYLIGADELEKIVDYYKADIGEFLSFYYYTLFYVFFYTGLRVEEMVALQWKHIDLRSDERIIHVENAISRLEKKNNVKERVDREIYYTKNDNSKRGIPIFDIIYQLLLDWRESYHYESGLSYEEMQECFVFPRRSYHDRIIWDTWSDSNNWLKELKKALEYAELPNTDLQMLRHSCGTFLVADLHMSEQEIYEFFGHRDSQMLKMVYAKLETQQKTDRMKRTFKDYYTPTENKRDIAKQNARQRMIERVSGDNASELYEARKSRILQQVVMAFAENRECYYYSAKDKDIIDEISTWMPNIKFVLESEG